MLTSIPLGALAAFVRDTFYLDGGYMNYVPGFANGTYGAPTRSGEHGASVASITSTPTHPADLPPFSGLENIPFMYMINFTQPFDTTHNVTEYLRTLNKTAGAPNNRAPSYLDGAILANDHELYLYGGLLRDTDNLQPPPANTVLGYERDQYGPHRDAWEPGFVEGRLPDNLTRFVTAGAAVSVPAENQAFYFSGLRRPDGADIRVDGHSQYNATAVANSLVVVDLSSMHQERWTNLTLPSAVSGRAGAELVWIPVADQGLLLVIGGVIYPDWAFESLTTTMKNESVRFDDGGRP